LDDGKKGLIGTKLYTRSRVGGRRRINVGSLKGTKIEKKLKKKVGSFGKRERGQLDLEGQFGSLTCSSLKRREGSQTFDEYSQSTIKSLLSNSFYLSGMAIE
jgi:hypothetical protein